EFTMFDHSVVANDHFSDRIGKVGSLGCADVAFDDREMTAFLGNDQIAWIRRNSRLARRREKKQMNGLVQGFARRQMDESAVLEKGCVERSEGIIFSQSVLPEMFFDKT